MHITAVSLGAAQGRAQCTPCATIIETTDDRQTTVNVQWDDLGPIGEGETVTEWFYNLLARMVENYDDHTITAIVVESKTPAGEAADAS